MRHRPILILLALLLALAGPASGQPSVDATPHKTSRPSPSPRPAMPGL